MFTFKNSNSLKINLSDEQRKQLSSESTIENAFNNEPAGRLYEKVGFIQTDIINENGVHEVNMILNL